MNKMTIFKPIILCGLLYSSAILFAESPASIDQIKKERKIKAQSFANHLSQVHSCKKALDHLFTQVADIKNTLSKNEELCGTIHTERQLNQCFQFRSDTLNEMEALKSSASNFKTQCSFPVFRKKMELIHENLELPLNSLNRSLSLLTDIKREVAHYKRTQFQIYNKYKLLDCHLNAPIVEMSLWDLKAQRAFDNGNIHLIKQSLRALEVLNDYISTLYSLCNGDEAEETALNQTASSHLKNIVTNSQNILDNAKNKFSDFSFDQLSQKMCQNLKDTNKDLFGLCEDPLNNPSWVYSAHCLWSETLKERGTDDEIK